MKQLIILSLLTSGLFLISCSSNRSFRDTKVQDVSDEADLPTTMNYLDLIERLRREVAVQILGSGSNISARIRGAKSFQGEQRPLIVVNGTVVGRDLVQVNRNLDPPTIKKIRILKSYHELTIWGDQGVAGVIMVETTNKI
ncbi:MAG TPA: hypothetical protein PKC30_00450 [Saprospiraceae bacterium]|nr:hypothetical protein [Saprospiraceae bacterium]